MTPAAKHGEVILDGGRGWRARATSIDAYLIDVF
jgi:hypothetical protein